MINNVDKGSKFIYKNNLGPEASSPDLVFRWLDRIKNAQEKLYEGKQDSDYLPRLKNVLYKKYIPTPENFPREEFLRFQSRAAEQLGHGRIKTLPEEGVELEIKTQKESLDEWVDYFASPDSSSFPVWAKYWAFHGVVKMSGVQKVDPETMLVSFTKREENTFGPFPELNREALAKAVEHIVNKVETGINLNEALKQESFRGVYTFYLNKLRTETTVKELEITEGRWVKYKQGKNLDELDKLVTSLEGKNTGWCTAGKSTADAQLSNGDFYVYYSKSAGDKPNPRIAIRMEGRRISEVRGIASGQNLDEIISGTDILENKLAEFGSEGEIYKKRNADMKKLTAVKSRHDKSEELSKEDLRFLYIEDIEGFGYGKDPRIDEIKSERVARRVVKKDLSIIFDNKYKPEEISLTRDEALSGGIKYHYGNLSLHNLTSAEGLVLPQSVGGYLNLDNLTSAEGLVLPQSVGGDLYLDNLTSAEGLVLPQSVGGNLHLYNLTSAEGLVLPQSVGGYINLYNLTSAEGLVLPQSVGGGLSLNNLTSAEGLVLPQSVGRNLHLDNLTSAEGLVFPQSVGGYINLRSILGSDFKKLQIKYPYIYFSRT